MFLVTECRMPTVLVTKKYFFANDLAYPISFDWSTFFIDNEVVIFILIFVDVSVFDLNFEEKIYIIIFDGYRLTSKKIYPPVSEASRGVY